MGLPFTAASWVADVFAVGPASQAGPAATVLGALPGVLLPVAIGVAVLRYRLNNLTWSHVSLATLVPNEPVPVAL